MSTISNKTVSCESIESRIEIKWFGATVPVVLEIVTGMTINE